MTGPSKSDQELIEKNSVPKQKIVVRMDNVLNRVVLIISILTSLGLIATPFIYEKKMGSVLIILVLLSTMIVAKFLIWRGQVRLAGICTVSIIWLIFFIMMLLGGGLYNINVLFFVSVTVMAGLLFGERATLWVAGAGITMGFAMAVMTVLDYLPPRYFQSSPFGNWAQLVLALVLTASMLNIALRDRNNALNMANKQLADRLEADDALQKSEERYRSLVENADEIIMVIQDGMIKFVNTRATVLFGYSEKEFLSIRVFELVHLEDRDWVAKRYLQKIDGDKTATRYTYRALYKSGQIAWIENSSVLIDWEGRPATLNLITDITERRKAEEEKQSLEGRLQRAQKMEALGQLAGGVAHDLNNVLGVLSGYSELLLAAIPEGQRARGHVEKILQSTEKGAAIIQDLLTLARRGVTVSDVINLNTVLSDFMKTPVFEKIKHYHPLVHFKTECHAELLNIKGSPVHLEKTIMNLISNAAEAIPGQGDVTIRTRNLYLEKAIRGYDEVREGDYAVLTVSDTGTGIPAEHREKIFEPFYTKKTMGRSGTGLGLAIVWGAVKDHNGYIDVETEVGKGTTFTLYFPVTREEFIAFRQKIPLEQYMGNGEAVLVVDDIVEQRDVACALLTQLNYNVHCVASGEEAVEYLKGNKADILVLDMIMTPGIDGMETYQRVLEVNPKQKAILVSGFSETDRVSEAQRLGAGAYVKKPYVMEKIGVAIRDELRR